MGYYIFKFVQFAREFHEQYRIDDRMQYMQKVMERVKKKIKLSIWRKVNIDSILGQGFFFFQFKGMSPQRLFAHCL